MNIKIEQEPTRTLKEYAGELELEGEVYRFYVSESIWISPLGKSTEIHLLNDRLPDEKVREVKGIIDKYISETSVF